MKKFDGKIIPKIGQKDMQLEIPKFTILTFKKRNVKKRKYNSSLVQLYFHL